MIKVKVIDESHEKDLERSVNAFLMLNKNVKDIQFRTAISIFSDEQIYCFSCMIVYEEN